MEKIAEMLIEAAAKGAAGAVTTGIIQRLLGPKSQTAPDKGNEAVIDKVYPMLEGALSGGAVKTLVVLSSQYNLSREQIFDELYPEIKPDSNHDRLLAEFEYRLRYLILLGLVTPVGSEYAITNLGLEFLRKAQDRPKYEREIPRRLRF